MSPGHTAYAAQDRLYFNQYADGYSPYTQADLELLLADLVALLVSQPPRWVCEVGSADGQFSAALARHLPSHIPFLGVDIAERVLRQYPFHKLCGNAFQMPLPDATLDLMCYAASLHHLAPFPIALMELYRVLAPGGLVYFLEPNFFHPQRRFFMANSRLYSLYRQANDVPVNPRELGVALTRMGIDVVQLRYINIHFKSPGLLQTVQNMVSRLPWPVKLQPYVMPWFVLIGKKHTAHGR